MRAKDSRVPARLTRTVLMSANLKASQVVTARASVLVATAPDLANSSWNNFSSIW
ncbi:hypothetical protein LINGRAHAP2_LOCUS11962 [Linum grandiflorum]